MLKSLRIRNLATIEELELEFESGFSILTGETGAGKSMIIGSLRVVTGEKSPPDIVRTGEREAAIEAVFSPPDSGSSREAEDLLLRRKIPRRGNGKSYIDDDMVPLRKLKESAERLVDVYGQNDHVFLQRLENQLDFLDGHAGTLKLRQDLAHRARELRRLAREKNDLKNRRREREQRLDFLSYQIREIEAAALVPDEEENIHRERDLLRNAENIRGWVEDALDLSYNRDESVIPLLKRLEQPVSRLAAFDPGLSPTLDAINQFSITLREFSDQLIRLRESRENAREKLDSLEKRLSRVEDLKRKYGKDIPEILAHLGKSRAEHSRLLDQNDKMAELTQVIEREFEKFSAIALKLSNRRQSGARRLEKAVEKEIAHLGMKKARFQIRIETDPIDPDSLDSLSDSGPDRVEFYISPNPGEEPKPLRRTASGGELSRLMLALKTVSARNEKSKTMIFDEIDVGIGGKTADFVAGRLDRLAGFSQVLCITHLPQIASAARHHYKISKLIRENRTYTIVKKLSPAERVEEIARLLVGTHVTENALRSAEEMLNRHRPGHPDPGSRAK